MAKRILLSSGIILLLLMGYNACQNNGSVTGGEEDGQPAKNEMVESDSIAEKPLGQEIKVDGKNGEDEMTDSVDKSLSQDITIDGKTIVWSNGQTFETNIYDLQYIGQLESESKRPYLILSGRQCDECDANTSIYIHSPSDGELKTEDQQDRFGYPGKLLYYMDKELIGESRMFYGQILPNRHGVIWFGKAEDESGNWVNYVFLAEVTKDSLTLEVIESTLDLTLAQVKSGLAKELPGLILTSEP